MKLQRLQRLLDDELQLLMQVLARIVKFGKVWTIESEQIVRQQVSPSVFERLDLFCSLIDYMTRHRSQDEMIRAATVSIS